jgi:hypothetical protein
MRYDGFVAVTYHKLATRLSAYAEFPRSRLSRCCPLTPLLKKDSQLAKIAFAA